MTITRELLSITSRLERQRSNTMYNGYTYPTKAELEARANRRRRDQYVVELTEALGDYDAYLEWSNALTVAEHLDVDRFCQLAEAKLAEIEQEASEIISNWQFLKFLKAYTYTEKSLEDMKDHAALIDVQECARW